MNDGIFNGKIVVKKIRRPAIIGDNSTDFRCGEDDRLRFIGPHPGPDGCDITQIEMVTARSQDRAILHLELPHQGRAHHTAMASDPDPFTGNRITHELRGPSAATLLRSE